VRHVGRLVFPLSLDRVGHRHASPGSRFSRGQRCRRSARFVPQPVAASGLLLTLAAGPRSQRSVVHVKLILSELGFRSRSQVAVWAAGAGLVPPIPPE
jgi:hypothetical protein